MKFLIGLILLLIIFVESMIVLFDIPLFHSHPKTLKVGLIYSTTGFRAPKEIAAKEAALLAIQEINARGGVLGRQIVPFIRNAESNWKITEQAIHELINKEKVDVILGCWSPSNRHTIKHLFEHYQHLLITPYQYEGLIDSPHIIFLGITANQQATPTVQYCLKNVGKRFFLIGSDYAYAHIVNMMIKDQVLAKGGEILEEYYLPIESLDLEEVVEKILRLKPEVLVNSLLGNSNLELFNRLKEHGITASTLPVFSFTLSETCINSMEISAVAGHYAVWNYFQSIPSLENQQFVNSLFQNSDITHIDNAAEASYIGVHMWTQAVAEAGTSKPKAVIAALADMKSQAPEGPVMMDMTGRHAWKYSRIGQVNSKGQFDIVWESPFAIRPISYQFFRSQTEWDMLTDHLYRQFSDLSTVSLNE